MINHGRLLLSDKEMEVLCTFAVLPLQPYQITSFYYFLLASQDQEMVIFDTIHDLHIAGWLNISNKGYFLEKNKQDYIIANFKPDLKKCYQLTMRLYRDLVDIHLENPKKSSQFIAIVEHYFSKIYANHNKIAALANDLSVLFSYRHEYDKSLIFCKKAVEVQERTDTHHPDIVFFYCNLAASYRRNKLFNDAFEASKKGLDYYSKLPDENLSLLTRAYIELSFGCEGVKQYQNALRYSWRALNLAKRLYDSNSVHVADLYHDLSYIYFRGGYFKNAVKYVNRSYEIHSKNLPPMHRTLRYLRIDKFFFRLALHMDSKILFYRRLLLVIGISFGVFLTGIILYFVIR